MGKADIFNRIMRDLHLPGITAPMHVDRKQLCSGNLSERCPTNKGGRSLQQCVTRDVGIEQRLETWTELS
jgi:hypothetical protein